METTALSPRALKRRNAILDVAWKIFAEQGYERASMDAVATACGGSKATLYNYFKSKDELFAEAVLKRVKVLACGVFLSFAEQKDFRATLQAFGMRYLHFFLNTDLLEVFRLAVAEGKNLGVGTALYEQGVKKDWERVAQYLEQHIKAERLLSGGYFGAALHFKALLEGDIAHRRLWTVTEKVPPEEIATAVTDAVELFMRAYAPQ